MWSVGEVEPRVPQMEKIRKLPQSSIPIAGKTYWDGILKQ